MVMNVDLKNKVILVTGAAGFVGGKPFKAIIGRYR